MGEFGWEVFRLKHQQCHKKKGILSDPLRVIRNWIYFEYCAPKEEFTELPVAEAPPKFLLKRKAPAASTCDAESNATALPILIPLPAKAFPQR